MARYSLIIPVYNAETLLPFLFLNLQQIDYQNFEVIFVDDGSTDSSKKLLFEYKNKSQNVIVLSQENQGPGAARNQGLHAATGKYIWFVDCDDVINPHAFSIFDNIFDENQNIEILLISYLRFSDRNKLFFNESNNSVSKVSADYALIHTDCAPWTRIYLHSFITSHDFSFPNVSYAEDAAANFRMCCEASEIYKTSFVSYAYYENVNGITRKNPKRYVKDMVYSMNIIYQLVETYPNHKDALLYMISLHISSFLSNANEEAIDFDYLRELLHKVKSEENSYTRLYERVSESYENSRWWRIGKFIKKVIRYK